MKTSDRGDDVVSYYVSPAGDDGYEGTRHAPFRTVSRGVRALKPGETVYLLAGEYSYRPTVVTRWWMRLRALWGCR